MTLVDRVSAWLQKERTGPQKFVQIVVLIFGGILIMGLSIGLVGVFLAVTPLVTVLGIAFIVIYGIAALVRGKS